MRLLDKPVTAASLTGMQVSLDVVAKGQRIVADGRVRRTRRGRYLVVGESGRTYFVHKGKCRCKWNQYTAATERVCSHEFAALLTESLRKGLL